MQLLLPIYTKLPKVVYFLQTEIPQYSKLCTRVFHLAHKSYWHTLSNSVLCLRFETPINISVYMRDLKAKHAATDVYE